MSKRSFDYEIVVSPLHDQRQLTSLSATIGAALGSIGGVGAAGSASVERPFVIVVGTGGTEEQILDRCRHRNALVPNEPALLVTHGEDNSLPAALEALAALRQRGSRGRIVMLEQLADVASAVRDQQVFLSLQGCRLGVVGRPSDWLVASRHDAEHVRSPWGPELVPVDVPGPIPAVPTEQSVELAGRWSNRDTAGSVRQAEVERAASVHGPLIELMDDHRLDAITVRCFDLLSSSHTSGCLALAELNAEGIVAGCEGDIPSAMAMVWVQQMFGATSWMANPSSIDARSGTIALAHCTVSPTMVDDVSLDTHFESGIGVGIAGRFEPQPVTLVRIGGADLTEVWLAEGELEATKTSDRLCRTQASVRVAPNRATELLERPLGNHVVLIAGRHERQLRHWWEIFVGDRAAVTR